MVLRDLAHARAGDKGLTSNISVIAYRMEDFPLLDRYVTVERVRAHLGDLAGGQVDRYVLPKIGALNFVLHGALPGGVTRSTALDAHGKGLSFALLSLQIPEDAAPGGAGDPAASERQAGREPADERP